MSAPSPGELQVVEVGPADVRWSFSSAPPRIQIPDGWLTAEIDPFPAYPHDVGLVRAVAESVLARVSARAGLRIAVCSLEELSRSNGHSNRQMLYDDPKPVPHWWGLIFLSGKRIPPHPAVTRYLIAHEIGHHVEWWLELARKCEKEDDVIREYAELRGVAQLAGSGGTWHAAAEEVFANDFRLLVAGVEPEYWPHPGITRPESLPEIRAWWQRALVELHGAS